MMNYSIGWHHGKLVAQSLTAATASKHKGWSQGLNSYHKAKSKEANKKDL